MKHIILLLALVSSAVFSGPTCDWKPYYIETFSGIKLNNYSFQIITLDCNVEGYTNIGRSHSSYLAPDEYITAQEAVIRDSNNNIVVNHIGSNYPDGRSMEASLVATPDGFPYEVILTSSWGASNIWHTYHIYSTTPTLRKIGEVDQPVNKYQTTQGNGREKEVTGFYEDKGVFLIDHLTEGKDEYNWNVETLALGNNSLIPVDLRPYRLSTYKPFKMNEYYAKGLLLQNKGKRKEDFYLHHLIVGPIDDH
jgi:hypothetical protein